MPLYEYECDACGHRFEVIHQRFSDPPVEICPKCGGAVQKLFSSPAIQFKGSGFYITDYARAGKSDSSSEGKADTAAPSADSKSESKGETKGESKSESKSESKGESKGESKSESKKESKPETKSESKADSKSSKSGGTPSTS